MKFMYSYKDRRFALSIAFLVLSFMCSSGLLAQYTMSWEVLAPMPMKTSNNAVTMAFSGAEECAYSFTGLDSTKSLTGIHLRSFKYTPSSDSWTELDAVPDSLGKIAAAASTVNDIIYIMGGYHVFNGPPYELSSNKVHRFDPSTDSFMSDGASIPVPIDDHAQAVWRDSLIFLVTGWSDTDYVPAVQIYDPAADSWQSGTSVPSGSVYEAFGTSGVIIGDTIYYHGGSVGNGFSASGRLRKGVINPEDPTQIAWSDLGNFTNMKGYRSAAVSADNRAMWIGGSAVTYNYNGIAYNGTGGVPALSRILFYETENDLFIDMSDQPYSVMDLRGAAEFSDNSFLICGGMGPGQTVSNTTYRISYLGPNGLVEQEKSTMNIWPNPVSLEGSLNLEIPSMNSRSIKIYSLDGKVIHEGFIANGNMSLKELGISKKGIYFIELDQHGMLNKLLVH